MIEEEKQKKRSSGARNLIIMGVLSILIAVSTTGISMAIYHNSGDIYLDRSRPGFLPDEAEIKEEEESGDENEYDFSKTGAVTRDSLEEYLKNLAIEEKAIDAYEEPFNDKVLQDDHLGIVVGGGEAASADAEVQE
ncbi:hypothetical protein J5491_00870 [Candidatus Saccharibacteria bacterium]|nr:hypothetical protein [Candidatus Saccharibacteria bacterium]